MTDERTNQRQGPIDLRCNRDDSDVGSSRRNLLENRLAGELSVGARPAGHAQALERLRAAEVRVDEVALEMRGQHARCRRGPCESRGAYRREHGAETRRSARYGRRAERGDATTRQPG